MKKWYKILILISFCSNLNAQFKDLEIARKNYVKQDFVASLNGYMKYHNAGYTSADLYFNIANCYFKLDSIGKSILWYERALKQNPGDAKTISNLKIAKINVKDNIPELNTFFLFSIWSWCKNITSSNTWGVFFILSLWISISSFVYNQVYKSNSLFRRLTWLSVIAFIFSLFLLLLSIVRYYDEQYPSDAVIIMESIPFRTVPDENGTIIFPLREGNKIEVLESIGSWSKVKISNGEQGWLPITCFERI
jgi:tetratricopeptide (TPR) repeat protein